MKNCENNITFQIKLLTHRKLFMERKIPLLCAADKRFRDNSYQLCSICAFVNYAFKHKIAWEIRIDDTVGLVKVATVIFPFGLP